MKQITLFLRIRSPVSLRSSIIIYNELLVNAGTLLYHKLKVFLLLILVIIYMLVVKHMGLAAVFKCYCCRKSVNSTVKCTKCQLLVTLLSI